MIKVENLKKQYGDNVVLKDISLYVEKGEAISVIGPSGSGKSTFLRCINGLEELSGGHICVDEFDLADKNLNIDKFREKHGIVPEEAFRSYSVFYAVVPQWKLSPSVALPHSLFLSPLYQSNQIKHPTFLSAALLSRGLLQGHPVQKHRLRPDTGIHKIPPVLSLETASLLHPLQEESRYNPPPDLHKKRSFPKEVPY